MENKSKLNTVLLVIIIILLVVVLGYFFLRDFRVEKGVSINVPQEKSQNNLSGISSNQQKIDVINTIKKDEHVYSSNTFGYSIGYSGIDSKNVYITGDGKNINLFPNQSNIDTVDIVDLSTFLPAPNSIYIGTVTFGNNQYKKFKDNTTPRRTTYLISGLKNNKSIFISIEGDSDNPNYLDLASLKIQ